jgi:hypothetical protein
MVSRDWDASKLIRSTALITKADRVASFGSCFAANLIPYLKKSGLNYLKAEAPHSAFADLPDDNFSYAKFSAAYGNIYTVKQFSQLIDRAYGRFNPQEDRWHTAEGVVDPFRPALRYKARSDLEFDVLTAAHLKAVREVAESATVIIFTLGLTEAWRSRVDGAVFPACPGTIAGEFDGSKHEFHNFTVSEIITDLHYVVGQIRLINPGVRFILTVSPVPLVATATSGNALEATIYSKSALRAACGEFVSTQQGCIYFPAYEIITGPQAPYEFYEADRRNVSKAGVDEVMRVLLASCEAETDAPKEVRGPTNLAAQISTKLQQIECEEEASAL